MKRKFDLLDIKRRRMLFLAIFLLAWFKLSSAEGNQLNVFEDKDQDGLTNQEEQAYGTDPNDPDSDHDGYSDGTEVKSGYNPLKPAPGDKLVPDVVPTTTSNVITKKTSSQTEKTSETPKTDTTGEAITVEKKENLTEKFIQKLKEEKGADLSLLQEFNQNPENFQTEDKYKELSSVSLTQEELEKLLQDSLSQSSLQEEMELVPESEMKILPKPEGKNEQDVMDKEKKQIEEYFSASGYLFLKNAPFEVGKEDFQNKTLGFVNQFSTFVQQNDMAQILDTRNRAQKIYDELKDLEVPYEARHIHQVGISVFKHLLKQDPNTLTDQNDPLSMVMMVGKAQAAFGELQTLQTESEALFQKYGITAFSDQSGSTDAKEETQTDSSVLDGLDPTNDEE